MHVFTSITANYLPKARVLAHSLKKFHPEAKFHLVLSDEVPATLKQEPAPFDSIITINELPIRDREAWIFKHTLVELCTAVKGFAFQEIVKRHKAAKVFYFDPDMVIMSRLDHLLEKLDQSSVLLTPHQTQPETNLEAIVDNEICSLKHGVYNLGFLAIRTSPEGLRFINWWADRLAEFCYDDIPGGIFTDQRWVDLAPGFFEDIGIVRHPGCNVATWNLTHRTATGSLKEGIKMNGIPLIFYHFSGFDSGAQEAMLKKYGSSSPVLFELRDWYIAECEKFGQTDQGKIPCAYNLFDNKVPIAKHHRVLYRKRKDLQNAFKNPFATAEKNSSYYNWYVANVENGSGTDSEEHNLMNLQQQVKDLRQELSLIRKNWLRWRISRTYSKLVKHFRKQPGTAAPVTNEGR
ncbi:MAG: glycosyl transferase [Verrucomicrobia bacterium]|nr:glycosyl transferase [Verrucomicrobiota bacterium]